MSARWTAGRQEAVVGSRASLEVSWAKRLLRWVVLAGGGRRAGQGRGHHQRMASLEASCASRGRVQGRVGLLGVQPGRMSLRWWQEQRELQVLLGGQQGGWVQVAAGAG